MEKSNHRILLALVVIVIIGICGMVGYLMLDKSGMKLSGNSTTNDLKSNNFDIDITTSDSDKVISIDKTNIKVSGTLDDNNKEIKYNLNVKNKGTIDTYLYSVVVDDTNLDVKVLNGDKELTDDTIIESNNNLDIILVITKKNEENIDFDTNIKLVFNQYNK